MTELSKSLARLFPPSSASVAKRNQALKDAKKVFDKWRSGFSLGPEKAEEAFLMNLRKLGAQEGAIPVGAIVILTEFEHFNGSLEELLEDKEILRGE